MAVQLRTVKAFVESYVFAEAVAACEKAKSTTPFKWNGAKQTAVIGLNSVKLNKDTVIASYTLVADSVYCDYDPVKKKADIGSNFLEREVVLDLVRPRCVRRRLRSRRAIAATPDRSPATSPRSSSSRSVAAITPKNATNNSRGVP